MSEDVASSSSPSTANGVLADDNDAIATSNGSKISNEAESTDNGDKADFIPSKTAASNEETAENAASSTAETNDSAQTTQT